MKWMIIVPSMRYDLKLREFRKSAFHVNLTEQSPDEPIVFSCGFQSSKKSISQSREKGEIG